MATKRQTASQRPISRNGNGRVPIDWRSRIHEPTEKDPKKREESIDRAATRIKTTARIDTITLGRE
jgi:hypothetical protein